MMLVYKSQKGQTIIEALIALAALLLTISAISVLVISNINNSVFVKDQNFANKYAQQGIEYVRYLRNSDYSQFRTYLGEYCLPQFSSYSSPNIVFSTGGCMVNMDGGYIRSVTFQKNVSPCVKNLNDPDNVKVTVAVQWTSTKCKGSTTNSRYCHKSEQVSCFRDPIINAL